MEHIETHRLKLFPDAMTKYAIQLCYSTLNLCIFKNKIQLYRQLHSLRDFFESRFAFAHVERNILIKPLKGSCCLLFLEFLVGGLMRYGEIDTLRRFCFSFASFHSHSYFVLISLLFLRLFDLFLCLEQQKVDWHPNVGRRIISAMTTNETTTTTMTTTTPESLFCASPPRRKK